MMKICCFTLICIANSFVAGSIEKQGYEVGDIATDFSLKNVDGRMVAMSDFKNAKGFILVFDCNTCPYSRAYNSRIIALNNKYAPVGFPLIAINSNDPAVSSGDSFEEMVKEAKRKGYSFPYVADESQHIARTYGATNTPHVFVLVKKVNNLEVAYIGTIDNNARDATAATKKYVENAVDELLENKPVLIKRTKAVGCGIKWRDY